MIMQKGAVLGDNEKFVTRLIQDSSILIERSKRD
jgi:hypothetical protein